MNALRTHRMHREHRRQGRGTCWNPGPGFLMPLVAGRPRDNCMKVLCGSFQTTVGSHPIEGINKGRYTSHKPGDCCLGESHGALRLAVQENLLANSGTGGKLE